MNPLFGVSIVVHYYFIEFFPFFQVLFLKGYSLFTIIVYFSKNCKIFWSKNHISAKTTEFSKKNRSFLQFLILSNSIFDPILAIRSSIRHYL